MSQQSNNNSPIIIQSSEIQPVERRGRWSYERHLAAIDAMINYRPFEKHHTSALASWDKVFESVNNTSPDLVPLGSSAIRNYVIKARKDVIRKERTERGGTGTNDSESTLDNRILYLNELVSIS